MCFQNTQSPPTHTHAILTAIFQVKLSDESAAPLILNHQSFLSSASLWDRLKQGANWRGDWGTGPPAKLSTPTLFTSSAPGGRL